MIAPEASPTKATSGETATPRVMSSWPLVAAVALAFAGAAETAWLTLTWLQRGHVPCVASARLDCEALFMATGTAPLGIPLMVWGHAAYALAMLLALAALLLEPPGARRARAGFATVATGMAGTSVFLLLRMLSLGAVCPWCVLSAALSLSLGALAMFDVARGGSWRHPALGVLLAGAMVTLALTTGARTTPPPAGDARRLVALARHLKSSGARFYGVWWCTACREQKDLFGAAAAALPYVECSRDSAPAGVQDFPTWDIAGRRLVGVLPVDTLAARSGFGSR